MADLKIIPIKRAKSPHTHQEEIRMDEERKLLYDQGYSLPDWDRADKHCTCEICGFFYSRHPQHDPFYWLTVLCDDSLVKL